MIDYREINNTLSHKESLTSTTTFHYKFICAHAWCAMSWLWLLKMMIIISRFIVSQDWFCVLFLVITYQGLMVTGFVWTGLMVPWLSAKSLANNVFGEKSYDEIHDWIFWAVQRCWYLQFLSQQSVGVPAMIKGIVIDATTKPLRPVVLLIAGYLLIIC